MKLSHKKIIVFISLLLIFSIMTGCKSNQIKPVNQLSESEIAKLRETYPIHRTPDFITKVTPTLQECISSADSFIYGEVVGDVNYFTKTILMKDEELEEKRKNNGIKDSYQFYEYTLSVIKDTEGKYTNGEQITIAANIMFQENNPQLSEGMRVIVPVIKDDTVKSRHSYGVDAMFYVTEEGYAISAFNENETAKRKLSGLKVEDLLPMLKK